VPGPGHKPKPRKRRLPKIVSREEAAALLGTLNLDAASSLRDRCMFELMYRAGLRVGEACALMPRDVNVEQGTVRVEDGKGGDGTAYFDPDSVRDLLDRWRLERRRLKPPAGAPLFVTVRQPSGLPVSVRHLEQKAKLMARRAGVDPRKITPHVWRHSFATELLGEGFTIREVQEALRHADVSTTMIYTHVLDANLRDKIQQRRRP
jgi:integrase/recombinase XerD